MENLVSEWHPSRESMNAVMLANFLVTDAFVEVVYLPFQDPIFIIMTIGSFYMQTNIHENTLKLKVKPVNLQRTMNW